MQNLIKGISLILFSIVLMLFALVSEVANFYFLDLSIELAVVFSLSGLASAITGLVMVFRRP